MAIKLYKASSFKYTPFDDFQKGDLEFLNKNGVEIVKNIQEADIIISQNFKHLKKHFWRGLFGKKFLIWTPESRFDTHFKSKVKTFFNLVTCNIMNVYTKDVFATNTSLHCTLINKTLLPLENNFQLKSRKIVALMSFYKGLNSESLIKDGENRDLIALRTKICLDGKSKNVLDVFGKGWPQGISKEDSREGDWVERKKQLLDNYHFNLSFENTAAFNYMTEKIWDSIENYCLPIYYGKHTNVYALFPEDSFIDYSKFNTPEELFNYVKTITDVEFIDRLNKCILTYNTISSKGEGFERKEREQILNNIVLKLQSICKNKS